MTFSTCQGIGFAGAFALGMCIDGCAGQQTVYDASGYASWVPQEWRNGNGNGNSDNSGVDAGETDAQGTPPTLSGPDTLICNEWKTAHQLKAADPWKAGKDDCDPGTLSQDGINDAVRRINYFRKIEGLAPVKDNATLNGQSRWCAVLAAWNPPEVTTDPHHPPQSSKCYTKKGFDGTSTSNLSWGTSPAANAIDSLIQDRGTASLGHRRWLFNPPLLNVGIGYFLGANTIYKSAQCTAVLDEEGTGPRPAWIAFPPPGASPISIFQWSWSFHAIASIDKATVKVTSNGTNLQVDVDKPAGPSYNMISIKPHGWVPKAGETYHVTIEGIAGGPVNYDIRPVACE